MTETNCAVCGVAVGASGGRDARAVLGEVRWRHPQVIERLAQAASRASEHEHGATPAWTPADGACPGCVQQALLGVLLERGDAEYHDAIQRAWPLDVPTKLGAIPTPLRMHADPRFTGRGVTVAFVDSAFFAHPDLTHAVDGAPGGNRIRAHVDASSERIIARRFKRDAQPRWPGCSARHPAQWHGMMTSCSACGNGYRSHGFYRGIASDADVVLVKTRPASGHISSGNVARALGWLLQHKDEFGLRVVNVSVSGDAEDARPGNAVDEAVRALVEAGVVVIAAAGNDGLRRLIPPATAPHAITVGGLDDNNSLAAHDNAVWHSNFGESTAGMEKPELVAPSIWVAAPVMPGSGVEMDAVELFARRAAGEADDAVNLRIAEQKLLSPYYQHVEGTSFAAPIVTSVVAAMIEAHPALTPAGVREILLAAAYPVPGAPRERQGAGALDAGLAIAITQEVRASGKVRHAATPETSAGRVKFHLHDGRAQRAEIAGSWNGWQAPALTMQKAGHELWQAEMPAPPPGTYAYKLILDGGRWLEDPANPRRMHDGNGNLNSFFVI